MNKRSEGTVVCVHCGCRKEIADNLVGRLGAVAAEHADCRLVYTAVILFGVCARCREAQVETSES